MPPKRAVFLDYGASLLEGGALDPEGSRIRLRPGAVDALLLLTGLGYDIMLAGNQPGVALGHFPSGALRAIEEHVSDLFMACGLQLADCYWCPHHPEGTVADFALACGCRKPMPGLFRAAAAEHGLDLSSSWIVGPTLDDVEAGRRAGCGTVLLEAGASEPVKSPLRAPDFAAPDLLGAAEAILRAQHARG